MEFFCEVFNVKINQKLFWKKAPSQLLERILWTYNMPMAYYMIVWHYIYYMAYYTRLILFNDD